MKKEECLRILKEMSIQKDVPGGISNRMYSDLRRKFPWHFLMFSWKNKSEKVIEVHKRLLIEQYQAKVEILLKCELTQEDVDDLELINESLVKICNRREPIEKYPSYLKHDYPEKKSVEEILKEYLEIDLINHNLTSLLDEIEKSYQTAITNIQPTYGQYSSIKILNKYDYIRKQILNLDRWTNDELLQNQDREMFKSK
jgi:uncharacterized protein YqeY